MKNTILFTLCLFVSTLAKCQVNTAPTQAPTINLTGVPFEIAFTVKKLILTEYLALNQNPTGADKVILDNIDSQINGNGLTASAKVYRLNLLPWKYYSELFKTFVMQDLDKVEKIQRDWSKGKPLLRQIRNQNPQLLRQLFELNRSTGNMSYGKLDSLVTQ